MLDYHTHTSFSDDCSYSMEEMIRAAMEKGLTEYAITDHHDPDYPMDRFGYTFEIDAEKYHESLEDLTEKYEKDIAIIKGIELGLQMGSAKKKCIETVKYPYDFVIGSFHLIDYQDICAPFHADKTPEEANLAYYSYILDTIRDFEDFDVLGHINAIDRYTAYVPDFSPCEEIVSEILKHLIDHDKGIELNTSSFRYRMADTMPSQRILKMYKDLGGRIITFGSDSHVPDTIGYRYDWALDYLRSLGFNYLTTYRKRMPELIRI